MKRLKGLRNVFVLLVITGLILSGCTTGGSKQTETADTGSKGPVKVGVITFYSGALAGLGKGFDTAVRMALEDFNKDAKVKVELVTEDAGATPVTAKNGLDKLLESKPTSALALTASSQFSAMSPTLEAAKIATVMGLALPTPFEHGWDWIFGVSATGAQEATAGLSYMNKKLGKSKIALLAGTDDLGKTVSAALIKGAAVDNFTIFPEFYQPGDNDFTGNITKVRRQTPDAYFVYGQIADCAKIIRQLKQLGVQEPIFCNYAPITGFLALLEANEVEGLYGYSGAIPPAFSTDPKVQDFAKKYKEKVGLEADLQSFFCYDGAMMLFNAASKAGGDQKKIIENMRATQGYKGLGGTYSFDSKGRGRHDTNIVQIGPNKTVKILESVKAMND